MSSPSAVTMTTSNSATAAPVKAISAGTGTIAGMMLMCLLIVVQLLVGVNGAVSPPPGQNHVFIQIQFNQISKLDGVEQAFDSDFYMTTYWYAPKDNPSTTIDTPLEDSNINNFWNPGLEFINARGEVTRTVDAPYSFVETPDFSKRLVPNNGADWIWLLSDQRYVGTFTTKLAMEDFPYDRQSAVLNIESFWDYSQVNISLADPAGINKIIPKYMPEIVGWDIDYNDYYKQLQYYAYNGRSYDRLVVRVNLTRQPEYFLTKIVVGVLLLVYMCIWVFSLQIDEADRMMGTLQVFAGLITYLFVAAGDVPKVPYQTRLDLFMMWSFFVTATCLFIHGTLYYWRECDLDDEDEKKSDEGEDENGTGTGTDGTGAADEAKKDDSPPVWQIRVKPRGPFSLSSWYNGLVFTRQWDAVFIVLLMLAYGIGVAVIFGRPVSNVPTPNGY